MEITTEQKKLFQLFKCLKDEETSGLLQEVVELLMREDVDVNFCYRGKTPLCETIRSNDMTMTRILVDGGADVNYQETCEHYKLSPLYVAASHHHQDMIKFLINNGARVDDLSFVKETPFTALQAALNLPEERHRSLSWASSIGCKRLLAPLSTLIERNEPVFKCTKLLVLSGASVNVKIKIFEDDENCSVECYPLAFAVVNNDYSLQQAIISAGAIPTMLDMNEILRSSNEKIHFASPEGKRAYQRKIEFNEKKISELKSQIVKRLLYLGFTSMCKLKDCHKSKDPVPAVCVCTIEQKDVMLNLQRLCRMAVRKALATSIVSSHLKDKIQALEVPTILKEWLLAEKENDF